MLMLSHCIQRGHGNDYWKSAGRAVVIVTTAEGKFRDLCIIHVQPYMTNQSKRVATKPLFYFISMCGFLLLTRLMNCSLSLGEIISV